MNPTQSKPKAPARRRRIWLLTAAAMLSCWAAAGAEPRSGSSVPASRPDYSSFKIIAERNIFNPGRSGSKPSRAAAAEVRRAPPKVESFSLVGILESEQGAFAFFDGASSEHRRAVRLNETVAGWRLAAVGPDCVRLASKTNMLELKVGMMLRREDEGEWRAAVADGAAGGYTRSSPGPGSGDRPYSSRPSSPSSSGPGAPDLTPEPENGEAAVAALIERVLERTSDDAPPALSEPPAATNAEPAASTNASGEDDVLRRLMQRREKELDR